MVLHFLIWFTLQLERSLVLGTGNKYKTLDLVAESREQRDTLVTALKYFQQRIKKMELDPRKKIIIDENVILTGK